MALNDKDKEYIKKTVDDAVNKSEKQNEQKMTNAIRANNKSNVLRSKKDRQETLEYLNKVGVLTLAEKIELMKNNISKEIKETVNEAIPEDLSKNLKQSFKNAGSNVGKGLGQGVDAVKSLLQGDILGGMGSALSGSINAGVGLAQGAIGAVGSVLSAGGAAASILSAKKERDKRKKAKLQTEDGSYQELPQTDQLDPEENPVMKNASKMVEQKEKPIRKEPEEKTTTGILKKGLGGLTKGLELANGALSFIANKQKLILGSVVLGATGILALVGWFANGGMDKLIDKFKESMISEEGRKAVKEGNTNVDAKLSELKKQAEEIDAFKNNNQFNSFKAQKDKHGFLTGFSQEADKRNINSKVKDWAMGVGAGSAGVNDMGAQQIHTSNATQKQKVKFPFPVTVIIKIKDTDDTMCVQLQRTDNKYKTKVWFTKVVSCGHKDGASVKAGQEVFELGPNFDIIGDREHFFEGYDSNADTYDTLVKNNMSDLKKIMDKSLDKVDQVERSMIKKFMGVADNDEYINKRAQAIKGGNALSTDGQIQKSSEDTTPIPDPPGSSNNSSGSSSGTSTSTPSSTTQTSSSNTQKAQENTEKLKQTSQQESAQSKFFKEIEEEGKQAEQNITVQLQNTSNPDYPATHYSPEQWIRANNNELGL